jgi:hypothetical protein
MSPLSILVQYMIKLDSINDMEVKEGGNPSLAAAFSDGPDSAGGWGGDGDSSGKEVVPSSGTPVKADGSPRQLPTLPQHLPEASGPSQSSSSSASLSAPSSSSASNKASGHSDIFTAVRNGDIGQVGSYIASGGDINIQDSTRRTPLHLAAWKGNAELVQMLLRAKASTAIKGKLLLLLPPPDRT